MSFNAKLGRIPITIVEIDQDQCGHQYGIAPCTALIGTTGAIKCFNGFANCQDKANFDKQTLTMRFCKPQSNIQFDEYIIPSVQSVGTSPTKLNVGARSGTMKPLGVRAQVSLSFIDHPHSDNLVDPYVDEREYDPLKNGTFWAKWLKRNPYYNGRALRVLDGYMGQTLAEMQTRHYVIESISMPDSKNIVKIKAQDILRLADDDKAQAPRLSTGKLSANVTATQTIMVIVGGVQADYQQGGTQAIRIGDEVIRYTAISTDAVGNITISGMTRGSDGTVAEEYDAGDSVQGCLEYSIQRPDVVAYDLLINYGNINPAFIDLAAWQADAGTWLQSIEATRLLTEPMGVTTLLGELSEEFMFYIWWDEIQQLINFKSISPVFGAVPILDEENNLLQNETSLTADDKLRVSEIWVSYLPKNPVLKKNDRDSYKRTLARIDATSASENEYGERKVYELFSPWLRNESHVNLLSAKLLAKYRSNPVSIKFSLDAKDRFLGISDVFDIKYKGMVTDTGEPDLIRYQVVSKYEKIAGEKITIEAVKFEYDIDFRAGKWMDDNATTYDLATPSERFSGMWWADDEGKISGDDGYVWS